MSVRRASRHAQRAIGRGPTATGRRAVGRGLALGLPVLLTFAAVAYAAAIPGANYKGVASDRAQVTFTVSGDGTIVNSYSITGVFGHEPNGRTCQFVGGGAAGIWPGAPIGGRTFSYSLGTALLLRGEFTGPQTSSGTFRFYLPAIGSAPSCDTGTVAWTASTTARPLGGTAGGGTSPGGGSANARTPTYLTWVSLKRLSATRLVGSVKASGGRCVNARTVYLMLGRKRVSRVRTNARGAYRIAIKPQLLTARVRAAVPTRRMSHAVCAAGSSKFLKPVKSA
jgi:hypothetical protein